jgi:hypothetical protein
VLVANNIVSDATIGILPGGPNWIIAGNLIHDIRASNGESYGTFAINTKPIAQQLQIQFNTIVGVDNPYDDKASDTNTRCNVVIDDLGLAGSSNRGVGQSTEYNFLYQSPARHFVGASNQVFATPEESAGTDYCYWRRRWTAPELVCVPFAATTEASPHQSATASCNPDVAAAFGVGPIDFVSAVPEPGATLGAAASLVVIAALRRRESHAARPV